MKRARIEAGMTQKALAKLAEVPLEIVTQLENLRPIPSAKRKEWRTRQAWRFDGIKRRIALALDADVDEMFPQELDTIVANKVVKELDVPTALALRHNSERIKMIAAETGAFDSAEKSLRHDEITRMLSTLGEREAMVIRERFGIDKGFPSSLEEVSQKMGVTHSRVRQIEAEAIRKLRHPSRSRTLREYA
jgi:RNA polymerase sigma factor (sigma-70 family)